MGAAKVVIRRNLCWSSLGNPPTGNDGDHYYHPGQFVYLAKANGACRCEQRYKRRDTGCATSGGKDIGGIFIDCFEFAFVGIVRFLETTKPGAVICGDV